MKIMKSGKSCRWLAGFLLSFAVLFSSCTANDSTKPETGVVYDESKEVELVFYTNSGDSEATFNQSFGDALRMRFPNFTIKYISGMDLPTVLATGTKFDIYYHSIGNFEQFLMQGNLQYDMSALIKTYNVHLEALEPAFVDYMRNRMGGGIYGLPIQNNVMVLYYNKTIFEKFGVPLPRDGMSWDEALELAQKLTRYEGGKPYIGLVVNANNMLKLNPFSIPNVERETLLPTFTKNENWRTIYETLFIRPSLHEGVRAELNRMNKIPDHYTFVTEQNVAMYGYSSGLISIWADNQLAKMDWDLVSLPSFKQLPGVGSQPYPFLMGITSLSQNPDAAMQALRYMISDEYQKAKSMSGVMPTLQAPALKEVFGNATSVKDKNLSAVFHNKMAPLADIVLPYSTTAVSVFQTDLLPLLQGKTDINTSFRESEEKAIQKIKELKEAANGKE